MSQNQSFHDQESNSNSTQVIDYRAFNKQARTRTQISHYQIFYGPNSS